MRDQQPNVYRVRYQQPNVYRVRYVPAERPTPIKAVVRYAAPVNRIIKAVVRYVPAGRHSIAYHEAGHVVASWAQGLHCTSATIVEDDNFDGLVRAPGVDDYSAENNRERRRIARAQIISLYAGWEAESAFNPYADRETSECDDTAACNLMPYCDASLKRLRREARKLIQQHWCAVQAVAAELLARQSLNAAELAALRSQLFAD